MNIKTNNILKEFGADIIFADTPINRFRQKELVLSQPKGTVSLSSIQGLEELRARIEAFEGCPLKKTALNLVFCDGNPAAKIMLVGEAPGENEDRLGKPFVGMSGQLLTRIFKAAGWERNKDLYLTNVIPWRPPGNRQPTPQELKQFLPFLQRHIALIKPEILILVGGTATKALLTDKEGITKLRGRWFDLNIPGLERPVKTTAIYHPAYLLRSSLRKKDVWKDMLMIRDTVAHPL